MQVVEKCLLTRLESLHLIHSPPEGGCKPARSAPTSTDALSAFIRLDGPLTGPLSWERCDMCFWGLSAWNSPPIICQRVAGTKRREQPKEPAILSCACQALLSAVILQTRF